MSRISGCQTEKVQKLKALEVQKVKRTFKEKAKFLPSFLPFNCLNLHKNSTFNFGQYNHKIIIACNGVISFITISILSNSTRNRISSGLKVCRNNPGKVLMTQEGKQTGNYIHET